MNLSRRFLAVICLSVEMALLIPKASFAYISSAHPDEKIKLTIPPGQIKIHGKTKSSKISDPATSVQDQTPISDKLHPKFHKPTWGVDNEHPEEYWFDSRIHSLGNHGFWGAVHAAVSPLATKVIDVASYHGIDMRQQLAQELSTVVRTQRARVIDLCCGVGMSTRALQNAFPEATAIVGMDTSKEMVAMANFLTGYRRFPAIRFQQGNAESTKLPDQSFDLVTVMYALHEAPMDGRTKILEEARRLLSPGGVLAVIDIATDYIPSQYMLKGEPYVQEYQQNINRQLQHIQGFKKPLYRTIVPNHLGMWTLTRSPRSS